MSEITCRHVGDTIEVDGTYVLWCAFDAARRYYVENYEECFDPSVGITHVGTMMTIREHYGRDNYMTFAWWGTNMVAVALGINAFFFLFLSIIWDKNSFTNLSFKFLFLCFCVANAFLFLQTSGYVIKVPK